MERRLFFQMLTAFVTTILGAVGLSFSRKEESHPRTGIDLARGESSDVYFVTDYHVEEWCWQERWPEGVRHYRGWCFWNENDPGVEKRFHFERQTHPVLGPVRRVP